MQTTKRPPFEKITQEGYDVRTGEYIGQAWDLVKAHMGLFIGYTLLFFLIKGFLSIIPGVGGIAQAILAPALTVGFAAAAHKASIGQKPELSDCFGGFSQIGNLFLVNLLISLIAVVCFVPLVAGLVFLLLNADGGYINSLDDFVDVIVDLLVNPIFLISMFVSLALILAISALFIFAPYYVFFYQMSATEAMRTSYEVAKIRLGGLIGFNIVLGLLLFGGAILCGIGLIFVYPIAMVAIYLAFANINDLQSEQPVDLDKHLID